MKKLFNTLKYIITGKDTTPQPTYMVLKNPTTGKWGIYDEDGFAVRTYTRRRDAVRGATRGGYTLVS